MDIGRPVTTEIESVGFGVYNSDDIRRISVKALTCPRLYAEDGAPSEGGLYDPVLGPHLKGGVCATCCLGYFECQGHPGHIDLPLPVYNPIFFRGLHTLLRGTCIFCYRLRMPAFESFVFRAKLALIHYGQCKAAAQLDMFLPTVMDTKKAKAAAADDDPAQPVAVRENIDAIIAHVESVLKGMHAPATATTMDTQERRRLIADIQHRIVNATKCSHCGAPRAMVRHDSCAKIFVSALTRNAKAFMTQHNVDFSNLTVFAAHAASFQTKPILDYNEYEDTDDSDYEATATPGKAALKPAAIGSIYLNPQVVKCIIEMLWQQEYELLDLIFDAHLCPSAENLFKSETPPRKDHFVTAASKFFFTVLPVAPTKFRPISKMGEMSFDHPQNTALANIIREASNIREHSSSIAGIDGEERSQAVAQLGHSWLMLQTHVNCLIDSNIKTNVKRGGTTIIGIRQLLEKKEGLFRKHMMGKRVNYAARSVISPDPWIEPGEIGIPLVFARKLTYPEPVTGFNTEKLMKAIINGPDIWPGATHVQLENGALQTLSGRTKEQRTIAAKQLLIRPSNGIGQEYNSAPTSGAATGKKVFRHLDSNDIVLLNRQPTLHRPSIMAHRARVLPGEKTLRLHYANCNSYNADFDGDEMNVHLPQNDLARAEAYTVVNTENQYLSATDGSPLRGLIQDHVVTGVLLTSRNTFVNREVYFNLVYSALPKIVQCAGKVLCLEPAILLPKKLWTGKQVVSTILHNLLRNKPPINLSGPAKVSAASWGLSAAEEAQVVFCQGDLVCGVLDKSQLGASSFGLVHAVHQLYGGEAAGNLLGSLGRLFSKYLHYSGFTCRMDDLLLSLQGEADRSGILERTTLVGPEAAAEYTATQDVKEQRHSLECISRDVEKLAGLDAAMKTKTNQLTTEVIGACIPNGLFKRFPSNGLQLMTLTGAKGSNVNVSQISCCLGQQELEGRRVPLMVSGRTLPSFKAYDTSARAGGFIAGRFLTGIKPQEYFFHCMAGREGLIDTAVKTSRSGYLQRCLVKHLEGVRVHYDGTVRAADGSVLQFLYGDDGLDATQKKYLSAFEFCALNADAMGIQYKPNELVGRIDETDARLYSNMQRKNPLLDTVQSVFSPYSSIGSVSLVFAAAVRDYIRKNPQQAIFASKRDHFNHSCESVAFKALMNLMYLKSLVQPGESVGVLAAQSIGEPSTQMTLNTFHFAGFGAKNVTLGIPRLREIIMCASTSIKTPSMAFPFRANVSESKRRDFCKKLCRLMLSAITEYAQVQESVVLVDGVVRHRKYRIKLKFFDEHLYSSLYSLTSGLVRDVFQHRFVQSLTSLVQKEVKRKKTEESAVDDLITVRQRTELSTVDTTEGDATEERYASRQQESGIYSDDEDKLETIDPLDADIVSDEENEDCGILHSIQQNAKNSFITDFKFDMQTGATALLEVTLGAAQKKIQMAHLVEKAIKATVVREVKGIRKCFLDDKLTASTAGVNFHGLWEFCEVIDIDSITTNDIASALQIFGVEAARSLIVSEIAKVFEVYGISVDQCHLGLCADYMTFEGGYRPFNRIGIANDPSPILKMSFETTCAFLTAATLNKDIDTLHSPASRLVVGKVVECGSNCISIIQPLE